MYEPGMEHHSIAYTRVDSALQNAVTIYFYPKGIEFEKQFEFEKQQIVSAHLNSKFLTEREDSFEKNGASFRGRVATFSYDENFAGKRQTVYSQVILIDLPLRFVKLRSTAPLGQDKLADVSVLGLMEVVNWAY